VVPATPITGRRDPRSHGPPWECRPRRSASLLRGGPCSPAERHAVARIARRQHRAVAQRGKRARAAVCVSPPARDGDRRAGTAPLMGRSGVLGRHAATRFPLERVAAPDGPSAPADIPTPAASPASSRSATAWPTAIASSRSRPPCSPAVTVTSRWGQAYRNSSSREETSRLRWSIRPTRAGNQVSPFTLGLHRGRIGLHALP
jgi:hypothetical protein